MNYHYYLMLINFCVMLTTAITGVIKFKKADLAFRVFTFYVFCSLFMECLAYYFAIRWQNNLAVYSINSIVELILLCLYFNYTIAWFRKQNGGYYLALFSLVFGFIDMFWRGGIFTQNTLFTLYEAFVVIILGMISTAQYICITSQLKGQEKQHSRIALILIFFWTTVFVNWGLYDEFTVQFASDKWIIDMAIFILNIIANIGFMIVFFLFPKNNIDQA